LAESQAVFGKQKQYIEKRLHDVDEKLNQVKRLQALQISPTDPENRNRDIDKRLQDIDNKLEILSKIQSQRIGDEDWVKFE
jgi:tetrahydromethanopterin S-methyltransferase subunit G